MSSKNAARNTVWSYYWAFGIQLFINIISSTSILFLNPETKHREASEGRNRKEFNCIKLWCCDYFHIFRLFIVVSRVYAYKSTRSHPIMNRHNSREMTRIKGKKKLCSLSISGLLPIFHLKKKSKAAREWERKKSNFTIPLSFADEKCKDLFFMTSLNLHLLAQSFRAWKFIKKINNFKNGRSWSSLEVNSAIKNNVTLVEEPSGIS